MDKYNLELDEQEAWAVAVALSEYKKNPISLEHGTLASAVYERLKEIILKRSLENSVKTEAVGTRFILPDNNL